MTQDQVRLVEENHNLIYGYLRKRGLPVDDWYDILAIALCEAAMAYDSHKSNFSTLAYLKFGSAVWAEWRRHEADKRKADRETVSLSIHMMDDDDDIERQLICIEDGYQKTEIRMFLDVLIPKLSQRDKDILRMRINGNNYRDIGKTLGISWQAAQRRMKKVQETARNMLNGDQRRTAW